MTDTFYNELLQEGEHIAANAPQAAPAATDTRERVESLIREIKSSGTDITTGYDNWLKAGFALASEFGESGRPYFHDISRDNATYDATECDRKFDECLRSESGRTSISTLFYLAEHKGVTLPHQQKSITPSRPAVSKNATSDKNVALSFVEADERDKTLPHFAPEVYQDLPSLLRDAVSRMNIPQEKDLVLIGSIATLSSALLPLRTIYHGKTIYPNLFLFVPGPAGSGKGRLDFCYRLVRPIHNEKHDLWKLAQEEYNQEMDRYRALSKKEKAVAVAPVKPPISLLKIPANSSATVFAEAMADNGNMLMFETEGDTVVNTFKSDYGNYSDNFRKAFAHEEFGYLRRGNDNEEREVSSPRLSVVLSGTPEQVKSLIHDAENGLLSRFVFYCMSGTSEWLDGFSDYDSSSPLEKVFDALGDRFLGFYRELNKTPEVRFSLSLVQKERFNDFFRAEKQKMLELNGELYTASTHRLSWAALRIAMVLTSLRVMDSGHFTEALECSDTDFETVMSMIRTISAHNDYIFNVLNDGVSEDVKVSETYSSAARDSLLSLLPVDFNAKDLKAAAVHIGKSLRTVERQIRRAIDKGQVRELGKGKYRKS